MKFLENISDFLWSFIHYIYSTSSQAYDLVSSWYPYQKIIFLFTLIGATWALTQIISRLTKWCHIKFLKLEFWITINPAQENEIHKKQVNVKPAKLELIYFKIRNKSKVTILEPKIWIMFEKGFEILDELEANRLEKEIPMGTLHQSDFCLIYKNRRPNYANLIWGKGKLPTLHMINHAFYDPSFQNLTTILHKDDLFIPLWVRTAADEKEYKVRILIKPSNIDKEFKDELILNLAQN